MKKLLLALTLLSSISVFALDPAEKLIFEEAIETNDASLISANNIKMESDLGIIKKISKALLEQLSEAKTMSDFNSVVIKANNTWPLLDNAPNQQTIILNIRDMADDEAQKLAK